MAADLRETQENQGVSEKRLDKLEFVDQLKGALLYTCCVYCAVCDFAVVSRIFRTLVFRPWHE